MIDISSKPLLELPSLEFVNESDRIENNLISQKLRRPEDSECYRKIHYMICGFFLCALAVVFFTPWIFIKDDDPKTAEYLLFSYTVLSVLVVMGFLCSMIDCSKKQKDVQIYRNNV